MATKFLKVKTEHTILKEFHKFLQQIEKIPEIQRIIPGRIDRVQSGKSNMYVNFSYITPSGLKYNMCKGSTAQEIFVICAKGTEELVQQQIEKIIIAYIK